MARVSHRTSTSWWPIFPSDCSSPWRPRWRSRKPDCFHRTPSSFRPDESCSTREEEIAPVFTSDCDLPFSLSFIHSCFFFLSFRPRLSFARPPFFLLFFFFYFRRAPASPLFRISSAATAAAKNNKQYNSHLCWWISVRFLSDSHDRVFRKKKAKEKKWNSTDRLSCSTGEPLRPPSISFNGL